MDRQTWSSKIATTHTKLIIIHTNDTPNTRTTLRHSYPNHHHTHHTVDTSTSHTTHTSSAPTLYHSSSHVPHYRRSSCCLIFSLQPVSVCFRSLLSPPAISALSCYDNIFIIIKKTSYYDHIFITKKSDHIYPAGVQLLWHLVHCGGKAATSQRFSFNILPEIKIKRFS